MKKIFLVISFMLLAFSQTEAQNDSTMRMGHNYLPESYISTLEWLHSAEYPERICTLVNLENGDVDTLFFDERKHLDELNSEEMKTVIRLFLKLLIER